MKSIRHITFCITITLLVACDKRGSADYQPKFSEINAQLDKIYVIGVHPLHNPQRLHHVFGPLADYLSLHIENAQFKIEASRNYAAYDKKLYAGQFEFALPNPFQTVNAIDKGYQVIAKMADDENFRGIILVRKDSGINTLSDLKGKAISYPAPTALAATMMPQFYLQQNGLDVLSELDNRYVGSQESSIMNAFLGQTAAASTWPPPWLALSKERPELAEQMEIKWQTKHLINNGFIARSDVPKEIISEVVHILTNLNQYKKGKAILSEMELSAFERANNQDYNIVREFIVNYQRKVLKHAK